MGYIYVMSDIHGEYELFLKMLGEINFSKNDKLIILGDVLDRGPHSLKIVKYIMGRDNIELLMGNHEKMFLDYMLSQDEMNKYLTYHTWMGNGGYTTLDAYKKIDTVQQETIIDFIKNLPLYKIIGNYVLVHSGINMNGLRQCNDIYEIISKQTIDDILWSREDFYREKGIEGYTIIFGHTPTPLIRNQSGNYDFSIWYDNVYNDKIGIDCGAVWGSMGGMLGCIRLDDRKEFYVK